MAQRGRTRIAQRNVDSKKKPPAVNMARPAISAGHGMVTAEPALGNQAIARMLAVPGAAETTVRSERNLNR